MAWILLFAAGLSRSAVLASRLVLGEPATPLRVGCILLIVAGIVGLRAIG